MPHFDQIQILPTDDGSPTIEMKTDARPAEWMHHSGGAWSETLYIYRPVIELSLKYATKPPHLLSVGIGLGYNEIIAAAIALKNNQSRIRLVSYEKNDLLRLSFLHFILGHSVPNPSKIEIELLKAFSWILDKTNSVFKLKENQIQMLLSRLYRDKKWKVYECFDLNNRELIDVSGILYDPFSKKVNGELWDEENLKKFFAQSTADICFFGSYAHNGAIKRALKESRFQLADRLGFSGKRNCTLAFRPSQFEIDVKRLIDSEELADKSAWSEH